MSIQLREEFCRAVGDYRLLLDRGYPTKASLKLVGDRYRLNADERAILFRGVLDRYASRANRTKLIEAPAWGATPPTGDHPSGTELSSGTEEAEGAHERPESRLSGSLPEAAGKPLLFVDGYNVLFTVMNYLLGRPVFVCTDGLLRDSGGVHGRVHHPEAFGQAVQLLVDRLLSMSTNIETECVGIEVVLDRPVSHSAAHRHELLKAAAGRLRGFRVSHANSADGMLVSIHVGVIATADSQVVGRSAVQVWDLSRSIVETMHSCAGLLDLNEVLVRTE